MRLAPGFDPGKILPELRGHGFGVVPPHGEAAALLGAIGRESGDDRQAAAMRRRR